MTDNLQCPHCGMDDGSIERRSRNTAFQDEESNFLTSCKECWEEDDSYWAERWADYYQEVCGGLW